MWAWVRTFFTKKKIIWTVIILIVLLIVWGIFKPKVNTSIQTDTVKMEDLEKTVLATGQVVSSTDLDLSLQGSGVVKQVLVKEGSTVSTGQTLVVLDQSTVLANVESAQGALSQAQANYDKIAGAATAQDISVSQAAVDTATTALQNAKQNLIRDLSISYSNVNSAITSDTNNLFNDPQSNSPQFFISGTVQNNQELVSTVNVEKAGINAFLSNWQKEVAGVTDGILDQTVADSLSYISSARIFMSDLLSLLVSYTQGGSATTISADQTAVTAGKTIVDTAYTTVTNDAQAVKSAQAALDQANASLSLKQAPARPEDLDIAKAQILSAEGAFHSAQAALNNTVLSAPSAGTITQVDIKVGELAQSGKEVMKLLNVGQLHTEALVSEADIAAVMVGESIDNTFDALGPDRHFTTTVLTVNPASTVISGVVNYKVTGSLEKIPQVKPGMTDNMTIKVAEKKNVLAVPSSAIINKDNQHIVRLITDPKKKTYTEVGVQTGLEADGGLTEILSGLSEGQEIVTYMK